ncbi:probable E3 ubiquitin-protein ligase TRIML1 [Antechinus flavipes]|uniref:probable E3 ubiquitin-protein ligase TRIML1 n=1 Tax=Antechinus flavipes TaxID=38775 RepID=UPI0022362D5A|nr:probable E3 ubiquitin-protein ligase TRIML1 [Antechinus flavipes]
MDVKSLIEDLQASLTCSICLGFFTDPVTAKCGHSFCKACLSYCTVRAQETLACPECRADINYGSDLVSNRCLQQLSIITKMLRPHLLQTLVGRSICEKHGEKEKLFCEEDHKILCDSCSLAPEHKNHQVLPLEKVVAKGKEKLLETLNILKKKQEHLQKKQLSVLRTWAKSRKHGLNFKRLLMYEYETMHKFLQDEKILQLQELNQQFRDNLMKFERSKVKLSQEIQNLQQMLLEVEKHLKGTPSEILQDMKGILEKSEKLLVQEPKVVSEAWTTFPITGLREMLMTFYRDITLDPLTAHTHLILSEDLRSVKYTSIPQDLPNNKERFVYSLTVLGAQTFTSGRHYWEVDIGEKTEWEVGICEESIIRNRKHSPFPQDIRILAGCKYQNNFFLWNSEKGCRSSPPIHKVGIFLDYERGHVAFYNAIDRSLLYSFLNKAFQRPMRPYFSPCLPDEESIPGSLIICPRSTQQIPEKEGKFCLELRDSSGILVY